ncbi:MAG: hypothetical protein ACI88A_002473 [Paraglaciecola sp.]|jgi:hypothetical protein
MDSLKMKGQGAISLLNKVPTLRRMFIKGPIVALCSMGGVGSTALGRHIGSIADKTIREHAHSPIVYENEKQIRLGYVFGNPYNSVLSVFRRGYQNMNSQAMNVNSGVEIADLKGVEIDEYLQRGVDEFRLDRQFTNWLDPKLTKHPTILIKYEELADNIEQVLDFFGCDKPFEVRTRKSSWDTQPANIVSGLVNMYGDFNQRVEKMPAITILQPQVAVQGAYP